MAVDAKLLVLDEPTIGLDIIFRKEFYSNVLNDYFDQERTILITTHQVEEIENLLTDIMFINNGRLVLNTSMDALPGQFSELLAKKESVDDARQLKPIHEREMFGKKIMTFAGADRDKLKSLGEVRTPAIADLFVAMMRGAAA
jgi:ABC-2 type transport system ATP-binding protein